MSATCLILGVALLGGCGLGAGPAPTEIKLVVTRDFGGRALKPSGPLAVHGQETAMSLLMRNYRVDTRYDGGFVQSVDGASGESRDGRPTDWFYYINGVQASKGAAQTIVHPGDHIWWDLHDWSQTEDVPAVVGSFPEPFLNGIDGKRLPLRVECADLRSAACRTVIQRLRDVGAPAAAAEIGGGDAPLTLRVVVGRWSEVRVNPLVQRIEQGPRASGVYARFTADGRQLIALDEQGVTAEVLRSGAGMVAAIRNADQAPVWVVTGSDQKGVERAAQALTEADLDKRFALALSTTGQRISLPLPARGR